MVRSFCLAAGTILATGTVSSAQEGADWLVPGNSFVYESTSPDYETTYFVDIYLGSYGPWMIYHELLSDDPAFVFAISDYNVLFTECETAVYDETSLIDTALAETINMQLPDLAPGKQIEIDDGYDGLAASLTAEFDFAIPGVSDTPIPARMARLTYPNDGGEETYTTARDGTVLFEIDWGDGSKDTLINIVEIRTPIPDMTEERARQVCPGIFRPSTPAKDASKSP